MKLATFTAGGDTRIGIVTGDEIVDLAAAAPDLPRDMIAFLEAGDAALATAREAEAKGPRLPLAQVTLEAPVQRPGKIFAIGLNYADHVKESNMEMPAHQIWFAKATTAVTGPYADVLKPDVSDFLDYEAELCMVIGKRAKHVSRDRAHEIIAGFCCGNDVSVRDWQLRTPQFTLGKSFDTHAPLGPWLTTPDEAGDPHDMDVRCWVDGELRQNSNTKHLIFDCYDQIAELSTAMTLEPGDVIFTGTPSGVGGAMKPAKFLTPGSKVKIEIGNLGSIENTVVAENAAQKVA